MAAVEELKAMVEVAWRRYGGREEEVGWGVFTQDTKAACPGNIIQRAFAVFSSCLAAVPTQLAERSLLARFATQHVGV